MRCGAMLQASRTVDEGRTTSEAHPHGLDLLDSLQSNRKVACSHECFGIHACGISAMMERQKGVIARFGLEVEDTVLCASKEKSSLTKQVFILLGNETEFNKVTMYSNIRIL